MLRDINSVQRIFAKRCDGGYEPRNVLEYHEVRMVVGADWRDPRLPSRYLRQLCSIQAAVQQRRRETFQ